MKKRLAFGIVLLLGIGILTACAANTTDAGQKTDGIVHWAVDSMQSITAFVTDSVNEKSSGFIT